MSDRNCDEDVVDDDDDLSLDEIDLFDTNSLAQLIKTKLSKDNGHKIGQLFKKRFKSIGTAVVSNRIWLKCPQSSECDVLVIFNSIVSFSPVVRILLEKILNENLIVRVKLHRTTQSIAFYITATYDRFLKGAEEYFLKKQIKSDFGGGIKEFIYEEQEFYENIEKEELFMSAQERQSIIFEILNKIRTSEELTLNSSSSSSSSSSEDCINTIRMPNVVPNGEKLVNWCLNQKIIKQIFPLHDQEELKYLRKNWVFSLTKLQPMEKICSYFGIKLALYFAWLGFYTKSLLVPGLTGIVVWFNLGRDPLSDAILITIISGFNLIWSIFFNDFWKQKCSEYSYKWGTLEVDEHLLIEEPRPNFKGQMKVSEVTGKLEPHYPEYKRKLFQYFVTFPCFVFNVAFTVALMVLMFKLQNLVDYATKSGYLPSLFGLTSFLPKVIFADLIGTLNGFYQNLGTWLNDKENYREQSTHENHLIIKIITFQFINSYLSLFYIAFYLVDIPLLKAQLFAIFMTRQLTGNIKESLIPYIKASLRQIKLIDKTISNQTTWTKANQDLIKRVDHLKRYAKNFIRSRKLLLQRDKSKRNFNNDEADNYKDNDDSDAADVESEEIAQPEIESLMPTYPDTLSDYLEMVNQFGLIVFFAPAFPLAAFFSLANNLIEIRSDAFKMCLLFQRPFGQRVSSIGTWQNVLEIFSILGIVVNCGLLVSLGVVEQFFPSLSIYESVVLAIIVEHAFLAFNAYLSYSIPDMARWILIEKSKLEFRRREALRVMESTEIHNLKNISRNSAASNNSSSSPPSHDNND